MRWLVVLLALSLAPACTTTEPKEEAAAEKTAKKTEKSKKPAKKGGDKAGSAKKKPTEKKPEVIYGAAGDVVGELKLEEKQEADKVKTAAQLVLVSGEKEETVKLGAIVGSCEQTEPATVDEVTALWTVSCDTAGGKATVSIAQQGSNLLVARAAPGTDEYKPLRKIKLVEGAHVVAKSTEL